jgi:hypothetical protein
LRRSAYLNSGEQESCAGNKGDCETGEFVH